MRVWSVGEVLWDVFPDGERFGGAPLNVCANLQRMGDEATLLSAVGRDERGHLALERMRSLGLSAEGVREVAELPTGTAVVGHDDRGEPNFVIARPAAFDRLATDPELVEEALAAGLDWLYFGTLLQTEPVVERFTTGLAEALAKAAKPARCFYDMNLRTGHWNLELVERLSAHCTVLKLNEVEAETLDRLTRVGDAAFSLEAFCARWAERFGIDVICVTLGPAGCLVYERALQGPGEVLRVPGFAVTVVDTVGSGDAFAAAFLHGYHLGWPMRETARFANALGALVASKAGATPEWTMVEVQGIGERG
jgi:fructokinase